MANPLGFKPDDISSEVWMGVGGVMLVLLRSIVDGTRRTALQLLVGCIFGGLGAMAAGFVWGQSHYVYLICGVAAVITENLVIGFFNMSQQFAQNPKDIVAWFIQTVLPAIPLFRAATAASSPTPNARRSGDTSTDRAHGSASRSCRSVRGAKRLMRYIPTC
jgi:hypothetical protein